MTSLRISGVLALGTSTAIAIVACSPKVGGGGPDGGTGDKVCGVHATCDDCLTDFESACVWCAGGCQVDPQPSDKSGAWCSYGFSSLSHPVCSKDDGGALLATSLALDCRSAKNAKDPHCDPSGRVGTGPSFPGGIGYLTGGFLDAKNHRLVIGAFFNNANTDARHGAVFSVDLVTGDRTLVSATYVDGQQTDQSVGSGPDLPGVDDVKPSPDGSAWFVITGYAGNKFDGVYKIDPQSGARTLVYDASTSQCVFANKNWPLIDVVGAPGQTMAIAPDGTMYLPTADSPSGVGVAALKPNGSCSIVSMGSQTAANKLGTGPIAYGTYAGFVLAGTTLYGEAEGEIHSIDTTNGNRKLVSSRLADPQVGVGAPLQDGYMTLENQATLLSSGPSTTDGYEFHAYVEVDIATGNRTPHDAVGGPFPATLVDDHWFVPHPTMTGIFIAVTGDAVLLLDPKSGASMTVSR